jgi:hypothetical protein
MKLGNYTGAGKIIKRCENEKIITWKHDSNEPEEYYGIFKNSQLVVELYAGKK